jgi:hypothetical protein
MPGSWRFTRLVLTVLTVLAGGCGAGDETERRTDSTPSASDSSALPGMLVRAAAAPDSSAAAALADSMNREGWDASYARRATDAGDWPVNVLVRGDSTLARVAAKALRDAGLIGEPIGSRPVSGDVGVALTRVNRGTHGMSARVRWTLSGDRRALLVVEDARAVENDPLPNAFVFAVEGLGLVQRDSVWDVAPAPDWRRVAYARAYTTTPGEVDSIPPREWHRLAGQVGLIESDVRKNAFATSGMVAAYGVARPFVVDLSATDDSMRTRGTALPMPEGWRIAWTIDGTRLALGAPAELIADDAPASKWRLVDPATGAPKGAAEPAMLSKLQWTEGPSLDVSTAVDMRQRRAFRSDDIDVESEDGWIRVYVHDGKRLRAPRIIGPGIALTATANGRYIVAITADPDAKSYDPPNQLVVYHISHR